MGEVHLNGMMGKWSIYQDHNKKADSQEIKETKTNSNANEAKQANPNRVLDALSAIGNQNMAMISVNSQEVDPAKYLSNERIASIEESMANFEEGVKKYSAAIQKEFGGALSEDTINELAARAFLEVQA